MVSASPLSQILQLIIFFFKAILSGATQKGWPALRCCDWISAKNKARVKAAERGADAGCQYWLILDIQPIVCFQ